MTQSKSIADKIYNKMCEIERVISLQGKDDRGHLMFAGFRQCMSELKDVIDSLKPEPQAQSAEADSLGLYFERNKVAQPQQSVEADGYILWCPDNKCVFHAHFYETLKEANEEFGDADNFQIRPVKLQFLDEGKCKKE